MARRRPPEILRKSHAHGAGKARAKAKAALKRDLETATEVEDADATRGDDTLAPRPPLPDDKPGGRD
jgi:hypothetical protein